MKKIPLSKVDTDVYFEKLENGLEIYIIPKKDVNNIFATYSTKYGSNQNDFIPHNSSKMVSVPLGIAHFLEHKMFEQENGEDIMGFFSERGSDCNANTNKEKTTYLFSGPNFFEENLECLLNYVENPYFTDENVKKEQGIIEQEIRMYQDKPFNRLYEGLTYNAFIEHPMKYPIIGTIESIHNITKEDLYTCYNTFYHPSNMFLVVSGHIDPEEVIKQVKEHESKRNLENERPIELKEYEEPDKVAKKSEEIKMNITIPKLGLAYKISKKRLKAIDIEKIESYLGTLFDLKLGPTSQFNENLKQQELISGNIDVSITSTKDHSLITIIAESKNPKKVIEKIQAQLTNLSIEEKDFERRKKAFISNTIFISDSLFSLNNKVMYDITKYKRLREDDYEIIQSLNMKELNTIIKNISLENQTTLIINPEEK